MKFCIGVLRNIHNKQIIYLYTNSSCTTIEIIERFVLKYVFECKRVWYLLGAILNVVEIWYLADSINVT